MQRRLLASVQETLGAQDRMECGLGFPFREVKIHLGHVGVHQDLGVPGDLRDSECFLDGFSAGGKIVSLIFEFGSPNKQRSACKVPEAAGLIDAGQLIAYQRPGIGQPALGNPIDREIPDTPKFRLRRPRAASEPGSLIKKRR